MLCVCMYIYICTTDSGWFRRSYKKNKIKKTLLGNNRRPRIRHKRFRGGEKPDYRMTNDRDDLRLGANLSILFTDNILLLLLFLIKKKKPTISVNCTYGNRMHESKKIGHRYYYTVNEIDDRFTVCNKITLCVCKCMYVMFLFFLCNARGDYWNVYVLITATQTRS